MSRCGRSQDVLTDWRDHPRGCTADHGWADGYDGPCTDDPWDIVQLIDTIDPMFRQDHAERARTELEDARATLGAVRALVSDWEANAGSRALGDPTADTWAACARQLLHVLDGRAPDGTDMSHPARATVRD